MCSARQAADEAHARCCAARADLLKAIADLASAEDWHGDGAGDFASWLAARWQISGRSARELVADSEALAERPGLRDALGRAEISVDQCKALTVLSEKGDAGAWLENVQFWSLPELEREARKEKARQLERKDGGIYLRIEHTPDERYMRGRFQLHPEDGAAVLAAIEARIPKRTKLRDWDKASALALVELAKGSDGGRSQRPVVVLSVSDREPVGELSSGGFVGAETARRLKCDASSQILYKNGDGKIAAIGRTSRTIPSHLRRAVEVRDGNMCTFPACERTKYLECHHIVPIEDGGPTVLDNLVLVCWTHHNCIHEHKWSLRGEPGPHITWVRPDGRPFEPRVRVTVDTS
jgi:5-methylcytosine-specific restriction protein A